MMEAAKGIPFRLLRKGLLRAIVNSSIWCEASLLNESSSLND
jgi:hypothetical protein